MRKILSGIAVLIAEISAIAQCGPPRDFEVPAGAATEMVVEWSRQSSVQVMFDYAELAHYRTRAVRGLLGPQDALRKMLVDCPFDVESVNLHTLVVVRHQRICRPWMGADAPTPPCVQEEVI